MAFQRTNLIGQTQNQNGQNDDWKAQAFINIYVPTPDGGRRKLGSIALRESKPFEKAVIERLKEEGGLEGLQANAIFDFQLADKEVKKSDIGF